MKLLQIIDIIRQLPLSEKLYLIELISKDIRQEISDQEQEEEQSRKAAELLLADYQNDEELAAFTVLDNEDFLEVK